MGSKSVPMEELHLAMPAGQGDGASKTGSPKEFDEGSSSTRSNSNNFCFNSDMATESNSSRSNSELAAYGASVLMDPAPHLDRHSRSRTRTYEIRVRSLWYGIVGRKTSPNCMFRPCGGEKAVRHILKNISCDAKPGEILAIVGPSGAGKSTLLEILAGRIKPNCGSRNSITVNGKPVNASQFRKISGYVTQEDALLPLLTVKETLMFSAQFRLPASVSKQEKEDKVESLMSELGLVHVSDTRIGDESIRGISGGEKRRVSIGVDVIHDPAVLLLDEPTSGLDSAAALHVVQMLHTMAKKARPRTIILTIHQPSYRILSLITSVLLLARGSVVHHGSLESLQYSLLSSGIKIPAQLNALEHAMEIISEALDDRDSSSPFMFWKSGTGRHDNEFDRDMPAEPLLIEPAHRNVEEELAEEREEVEQSYGANVLPGSNTLDEEEEDDEYNEVTFANSRYREICILCWRFWKIIYRTQQLFFARILQAIVGGLGLGSVYLKVGYDQRGLDKRFGFFAFTLTFLLSSTTEALPIFLQERQILMRETSRGAYRVSSYVISNTLVFLPFLMIVAVIFAAPVYWLVGLSGTWNAFLFFMFIVWLIVLMANSLVVFLSAVAPNFITGNSLICTILGAFFLFSGYFISKDSIPKYWLFMHYLSLYKYPLDTLLINEYSSLATKCFSWFPNKVCALTGQDILKQRGLEKDQRWINVGIMVGFFIFYRILCFLILVRRASRVKR